MKEQEAQLGQLVNPRTLEARPGYRGAEPLAESIQRATRPGYGMGALDLGGGAAGLAYMGGSSAADATTSGLGRGGTSGLGTLGDIASMAGGAYGANQLAQMAGLPEWAQWLAYPVGALAGPRVVGSVMG
jgi:hypothetical protein